MEKQVVTLQNLQVNVEEHLIQDGYLQPALFICTAEQDFIVDAGEAVKDIDEMIKWIADEVKKQKAYKVFFIAEVWKHEVDANDPETILSSEHAYQIVEIRQDKVIAYIRDFTKEKEHVLFEKEGVFMNPQESQFAPIQESLNYLQ
jgi:hypothetical protein